MTFQGVSLARYTHQGRQPAKLSLCMYDACTLGLRPVIVDDNHNPRRTLGKVRFRSRHWESAESCSDVHGCWDLNISTKRGYVAFNWRGSAYPLRWHDLFLESTGIWSGGSQQPSLNVSVCSIQEVAQGRCISSSLAGNFWIMRSLLSRT